MGAKSRRAAERQRLRPAGWRCRADVEMRAETSIHDAERSSRPRDGRKPAAHRCARSRRGDLPVRVMVCQWSRTRPVLRIKEDTALGSRRRAWGRDGDERARLSSVIEDGPSANRRLPGPARQPAALVGHCTGASAAYIGVGSCRREAGEIEVAAAACSRSQKARQCSVKILGSRSA